MSHAPHEVIASGGTYAVVIAASECVDSLSMYGIPPEWAAPIAIIAGLIWRVTMDLYDRRKDARAAAERKENA